MPIVLKCTDTQTDNNFLIIFNIISLYINDIVVIYCTTTCRTKHFKMRISKYYNLAPENSIDLSALPIPPSLLYLPTATPVS